LIEKQFNTFSIHIYNYNRAGSLEKRLTFVPFKKFSLLTLEKQPGPRGAGAVNFFLPGETASEWNDAAKQH
jgi:hypothetical protein